MSSSVSQVLVRRLYPLFYRPLLTRVSLPTTFSSLRSQTTGTQQKHETINNTTTTTAEQTTNPTSSSPPPSSSSTTAASANGSVEESLGSIEHQLKKVTEENKKINDDLIDMKDRYKRSLAETENTRIRYKKLVDDAKIYGIQGFCKDLLEVADILNLAIINTPKDKKMNDKDFANLYQGLTMTEEKMQKIFTKNGLIQISPAEGEKFNPNFHEALFQTKIPNKESGTIVQVMKNGYRLHERVIRAAQVGVAQ
ncbi:unnamed protein product [Didymodactylos carnosus]|uniref:GrpE protein homolog n=1 Tax=Didymodactylos carnosus TaxID=1234261 RepID=A0A814L7V4_9BILA|nr:unnamed protein product [Didymodactylos carnosus]CAF1061413.1 unnamed protein product [Didymodactylos carnosus]CAF3719063.1 unnamed protein product [Didymodactylos carnosus]CAF3829685.1 unnamed protein product [Didymodactylos carnosus]